MKKILMMLALITASATAYSLDINAVNNAGFSKLTEVQKAEVIKTIATQATESQTPTVEKVEKWVDIGTKLGKGLGAAAKELGVAVNDFANSPAGQIATALIVWHMIGGQLLHIFGGLMVWAIGIATIRSVVNRMNPVKKVYSSTKTNLFRNPVLESVTSPGIGGDVAGWMLVCYGIVGVFGAFVMFGAA